MVLVEGTYGSCGWPTCCAVVFVALPHTHTHCGVSSPSVPPHQSLECLSTESSDQRKSPAEVPVSTARIASGRVFFEQPPPRGSLIRSLKRRHLTGEHKRRPVGSSVFCCAVALKLSEKVPEKVRATTQQKIQ